MVLIRPNIFIYFSYFIIYFFTRNSYGLRSVDDSSVEVTMDTPRCGWISI